MNIFQTDSDDESICEGPLGTLQQTSSFKEKKDSSWKDSPTETNSLYRSRRHGLCPKWLDMESSHSLSLAKPKRNSQTTLDTWQI